MGNLKDAGLAAQVPNIEDVNVKGSGAQAELRDRSIGDILTKLRSLSVAQVEQVLDHQRQHGLRFGEAAVALGLVSQDDVLYALTQQFHYPYAPEERLKVNPELIMLREPFGARAEAFRGLRSQIMMRVYSGTGRPALAVISPDSGDGKTYAAANLAVCLAQLGGGRTLLVDADMRNPRQHEVFGLENRIGLSMVLSGRGESQAIQQLSALPGLFVLPVGTSPPNPQELAERPMFGHLMRELCSKFDHVIVDTPAASRGADASVIAARCGAALIVARKHASRVGHMQDLVATFAGSSVQLAGVLLNEH